MDRPPLDDTQTAQALNAYHTAREQEALCGARIIVIRRCLAILDPQPGDHTLSYPDLLARPGVVVEQALAALEEHPHA